MPRSRPPYPEEFRAEAIALVKSGGESVAQIAKDLGISDQTLRNWVVQDDVDGGRNNGVSSDERSELGRLRKENRVLPRSARC